MKPEQRLPLDDQWLQIHNTVSPVTKPELNGLIIYSGRRNCKATADGQGNIYAVSFGKYNH